MTTSSSPPEMKTPASPQEAVPQEAQQAQIKRALEEELRRVKTPEDAERIIAQLEQLAAGTTEAEQGAAAQRNPAPAAAEVTEAAATAHGRTEEAAAVLAETAQQTSAGTPGAEAALKAAQEVLTPAHAQPDPETAWGAALLKQAVMRHLGPLGKLDAGIFLAINSAPHPKWLDNAGHTVAVWTNGGWFWTAGLLVARLLGVRRAGKALAVALPSIGLATAIVEYPLKAVFRRRRPFIDVVRALVVGKKPGSWSFPSGHTASAFGGAWVLSTIWPRRAPAFFAIAGTIGFSRIYVGAHYPGDVTSGAFFGMALSELLRRGTILVLRRYAPQWL